MIVLVEIVRALRRFMCNEPATRRPGPTRPDDTIPAISAFDDPAAESRRRELAMALMDADCLGYVVIQARRDGFDEVRLQIDHELREDVWPAMHSTLARMVLEADREGM